MLSYSSYMLTAVAALLVTCDAQHKGPGIPGLPRKHGLKGQTYLPSSQNTHQLERKLCIPFPGDPMRPGTLMGPPRRGNRPWAQALPELYNALAILKHRLSQLEGVLALNGKIREAGEKIIASNGKVVGFTSALESCEKAGGTLARPTNKEENEAILSFVQQYNKYAYLGIKEHENSGQFRHIYGTPLNYTNWHRNEPNGKGTEQCVEMYSDGSWNDKNCNQHRLIICEF
ncbi:pulmonary surfactant-associated protein A1-like isoform X1 [Falco naumanni]|uniref:pulmonary surfactant-associated protein A1-like isoform X1 n=1 Tax=Falco naumanni TaxID=148594 RepID=UPI001ADE8691|nr:pulmonary surfactant-associated protein A1-like isoform X1 [Falco naumanni]XP_040461921.1 pulmonary surfactant-associated protein A1-like isoform X1 [Falco naumanni]XP_040461922.1 pulmonary surfactant-associated protein A1-like isoform X1 [Falco naumanni]XP_040461923.1 pulmonary surfactant-associated protein A1-like isoform X1 [Falco naumanni]XP_040461924.1 pulmonary surfactant-associated protein A1-like isoform X1 [Falco naumanni]XP_040461925.1 pulmonary surfactant-associated protein A1-li